MITPINNFLTAIFPAASPPRSTQAVADVIQQNQLAGDLLRGTAFYAIQPVEGFKVSRLLTLSALPVSVSDLVHCMNDIDSWGDWMPRFSFSRGRPTGRAGEQYQEAKMKAAGLSIHYQILVHNTPMELGHQIYWNLDKSGFKKDLLAMGLEVNNGSCTFLPLPGRPAETVLAYEIHTQVTPLIPGTAEKITRTTIEEFPEFPTNLGNRALDGGWARKSRHAPLGRTYTMRPA